METESQSLISLTQKQSKWSTFQCILFCVIGIIIAGVSSNIDRMISAMKNDDNNDDNIPQYDIIIIGAGPAGLLQTQLLQQNDPSLKILLLEKQNRVGGRTFSSKLTLKTPNNIDDKSIIFEH
eukprot:189995_1